MTRVRIASLGAAALALAVAVAYLVATVADGDSERAAATGPLPSASATASPAGSATASVAASPTATEAAAATSTPAAPVKVRKRARQAACALTPLQIASLADFGPEAEVEMLRDALPVLGDRLDTLELSVDGQPRYVQALAHLRGLEKDWQRALAAHDAQQERQSRIAMTEAQTELQRYATEMRRAMPGWPKTC